MSKKLLLWAMVAALSAVVSALIPTRNADARPVMACPNEWCDGGSLVGGGCEQIWGMTCHGGHILDPHMCDGHNCY